MRDTLCPLILGGQCRFWGVVVAAGDGFVDGLAEGWEQGGFVAVEDGGPRGVEQDVADAGLAVEQDGDAALEALDGRDAVALDGGHEEEMGAVVEGGEMVVGDEAVEVDAVGDAEGGGHPLEGGDLGAGAGEVEVPVDAGGERGGGVLERGESAEDPVDALVGLDAGDGEQAELICYRAEARWGGDVAEAAHAGDVGLDAEVAETFFAEEVAGDDGGASAAQAAGGDGVGDGDAELVRERTAVGIAEERWGVVHEAMEAAHAGEGCVQGGLVAGGERLVGRWAALLEVAFEGGDLAARAGAWFQLDECDRMRCVLREIAVVGVGEEIVGEALAIEPAGESEQAPLGTAELHNLREEERPGVSQ